MIPAQSCMDELQKLGAVSDDEARRALDRYDQLDRAKPTGGQVARYGALGAGAGALGRVVGHGIEYGHMPGLRSVAGAAAAGALGMGAVPLVRGALDRRAERGTLQRYMQQEHVGEYGPGLGASTDSGTPTGLTKAAAARSFSEHNPNGVAYVKATGIGALLGAGQYGAGKLMASQAEKEGPGGAALNEHLQRTSPVPIVRPDGPVMGGAHFSPGSDQKLFAGLGGPAEPHVKVPSGWKNPAVLAHEIGHADINANRVGRAIQNPATIVAGNLGGGVVSSLGGLASGFSDNPTVRKAGILAPLAMHAPTLLYEAGASLGGLRRLRRGGAGAGALLHAGKMMLPAYGTYGLRAARDVAGAAGAQAIGTAVRDKRRKDKTTKQAGMLSDLAAKAKQVLTTPIPGTPEIGDIVPGVAHAAEKLKGLSQKGRPSKGFEAFQAARAAQGH